MTDHPPQTPLWLIEGDLSEDTVLRCEEALAEVCLCVSFYEKEPTIEKKEWRIEGISERPLSLEEITQLMAAYFSQKTPHPQLTCRPLQDRDWLKESYEAFPALTIGNFYIYGSHHKGPLPDGKKGLLLDAATAFGSGHHPTTSGCLTLLQKLSEDVSLKKILDLGCGSGILAMAAALLKTDAEIWASDNDPQAIAMTEKNSLRNGLERRLLLRHSEGFIHIKEIGPFDLILANILAQPLMTLASEMAEFTLPEGHLILSGFFNTQWPDLQKKYEEKGFRYIDHIEEDTWVSLWLQKD